MKFSENKCLENARMGNKEIVPVEFELFGTKSRKINDDIRKEISQ